MTGGQSGDVQPVRGRSVLSNSLWNYAGALFSLAATFVTTPIYLSALGLEQYGIMAVLGAIIAPVGVLNAGVTQATIKYVAGYSAEGDLGQARDAVLASLVINLVVGLVGAAVCVLAAPVFLGLGFKVSAELVPDAAVSLRLMGAVWLLSQIAGTFRGVLEGLRDQRVVVLLDAVQVLVTAVSCVVLARATGKLSGFVTGQLVAVVAMTILWFVKARQGLGTLTVDFRAARRHLRRTYDYSIWQTVNTAVAFFANFADRYFIGIFMSAISLGAYSVAQRLQSACRMMFYSVNQALFPAASAALGAEGESERLVLRTTWNVAFVAGLGLGWALVGGPIFLRLWVGNEIAAYAGLALQVLIALLFFEIPSATGSSYLNASGLTRMTALNNVATTMLTLGFMFPLGLKFGLIGVASSGLIGLVSTRPFLHVWMFRHRFRGVASRRAFFNAFYGVCFCCLASALVSNQLFLYVCGGGAGLARFALATLLVGPVYCALAVSAICFGLGDRVRLFELVSNVKRFPGLRATSLGDR